MISNKKNQFSVGSEKKENYFIKFLIIGLTNTFINENLCCKIFAEHFHKVFELMHFIFNFKSSQR